MKQPIFIDDLDPDERQFVLSELVDAADAAQEAEDILMEHEQTLSGSFDHPEFAKPHQDAERDRLESDVEAFLASGRKIKVVAPGQTAKPYDKPYRR